MKRPIQTLAVPLASVALACAANAQGHHKSFIVSTYAIHGTVQNLMNGSLDPAETWSNLTRNLKIDKLYLEVMRNYTLVYETGLEKLKKFFPHFPADADIVLLTEQAKSDPEIMQKIKAQLKAETVAPAHRFQVHRAPALICGFRREIGSNHSYT
jgi:hypothetical protein